MEQGCKTHSKNMLNSQLKDLIEEQKKYCPILTSNREYSAQSPYQSMLEDLDENHVLLTEHHLLEHLLKEYEDHPLRMGVQVMGTFLGGVLVTLLAAKSEYAAIGGIAATLSATCFPIILPELKIKFQAREKINTIRKQEELEGKAIYTASYNTTP